MLSRQREIQYIVFNAAEKIRNEYLYINNLLTLAQFVWKLLIQKLLSYSYIDVKL